MNAKINASCATSFSTRFSTSFATGFNGYGNWDTWAVIRRLEELRYPDQPFASSAQLPTTRELLRLGVDLFVLEHELFQGLSAQLFTRALHLGVIDVDAFNNGPYYRENADQYYRAMATVVDRVETRNRHEEHNTRKVRRAARLVEVDAINRSLEYLSEAI